MLNGHRPVYVTHTRLNPTIMFCQDASLTLAVLNVTESVVSICKTNILRLCSRRELACWRYGSSVTGEATVLLHRKIQPGVVDWSKVNTKHPLNKFKQVENCNYAITLGKSIKFSLVGVGGQDIQSGNKKLTLAIIWQMMRFFILNYLKRMSKDGREVTEDDIIRWCNDKVHSAGKSTRMESFQDKNLADSVFISDLLHACQPESVDYSLITSGKTDDEKRLNAQYVISCARKMGATVFLLWEDIVEVKPKMMLTFFGAVMNTFG